MKLPIRKVVSEEDELQTVKWVVIRFTIFSTNRIFQSREHYKVISMKLKFCCWDYSYMPM